MNLLALAAIGSTITLPPPETAKPSKPQRQRELIALGAGQDAGAPQIGSFSDNASYLYPASLGLIDRENGQRYERNPTPRVSKVIERLKTLPREERAKVHFIHYNHTNPIRDPHSEESRFTIEMGFNIAQRGDRVCLSQKRGD